MVSVAIRNARGVRKKANAAADVINATVSHAGAMADISSAIAPQTPTWALFNRKLLLLIDN